MTLLEKLDFLMKINKIKNLHKLADLSNVPYTTYRTMFQRGVDNIALDTARKICNFFDLTLDELLTDEIDLPEFIENENKECALKMKRKIPKNNSSVLSVSGINKSADKNLLDLSDFTEEEKELIFKIIELNRKNKNNKG